MPIYAKYKRKCRNDSWLQRFERTHIICLIVFSYVLIALKMECQYMLNATESVETSFDGLTFDIFEKKNKTDIWYFRMKRKKKLMC
jgi:hypothetical protein